MSIATEFAPGLAIQGFTAPLSLSQFKLIAFDMDSTLISIECVDEIADAVGRKAEVAAITEAAMRGEITDFKDSLRRRLALLQGVTLADMERVYTERLQINPGAHELIAACHQAGLKVLLVSGGSRWRVVRSPAAWSCKAGGTFATAPRNAAPCWKSPACWASKPRNALPWATVPTTCP